MKTNFLQAELPLGPKKRVPHPLDLKTLYAKTTYKAALNYVVQCGNFEDYKEICDALDLDAGNWTRILKGDAALSPEREEILEKLCGNEGLMLWRAHKRGKGVYDLQEFKDKRIAELEAEVNKLRGEIETLVKYGVIQKSK